MVFHPEGVEQVEPCLVNAYFNVAGTGQRETVAPVESTNAQHWQEHVADAAVRQVFLHLQQHGAVSKQELTQMLGSPRQVRRFARDFESYMQQVPFAVRIESTSSGKRYVRQS